jgi:hypothetical protein
VYERLESFSEAEACYRDALNYNSRYAPARLHLGMLLRKSGREADSRRELGQFCSEWTDADPEIPSFAAACRTLNAR